MPLTTQNRKSAYEVELQKVPFLNQESVANVQGMASIPTVRLERKLGQLSAEKLAKVKQAIAFAMDLAITESKAN